MTGKIIGDIMWNGVGSVALLVTFLVVIFIQDDERFLRIVAAWFVFIQLADFVFKLTNALAAGLF